jgi:fibronectin type 3 domain-containing protein
VGFSNLAVVQVTAPPNQPEKPSVTLTPDAIVVEWPAVDRARSYVVERSGGTADSFEEIGRPDTTRFRDTGFQIGESYTYRVRAIAGAADGEAEGLVSAAVSITPRDIFAPGKPARLRAVATAASVELSWEQSIEPDLKGYRVRRRQQGTEPVWLTEAPLESASYSDREVGPGQEYSYEVTAVDGEGNESEPSEATTVRVPE